MKKPKYVLDAEVAVNAAKAKINAAEEALKQAGDAYTSAIRMLHDANVKADESFPQCRIVKVDYYSSSEQELGRAVILHKTPTGMLVVRYLGNPSGDKQRFVFDKYSGAFRQSEKSSLFTGQRELRDVPSEFIPTP
jgi:hypothetical protein